MVGSSRTYILPFRRQICVLGMMVPFWFFIVRLGSSGCGSISSMYIQCDLVTLTLTVMVSSLVLRYSSMMVPGAWVMVVMVLVVESQ